MKVCQPGNDDWNLPSWCIEREITTDFVIQGLLELIVIIIILSVGWYRWKMSKKEAKEREMRENELFGTGRTFK